MLQHPCPVVGHENIRVLYQLADNFLAFRGFQIQSQAPLVPVQSQEDGAFPAHILPPVEIPVEISRAGPFYIDDVRPQIPQKLQSKGPLGEMGEAQNFYPLQRTCHSLPPFRYDISLYVPERPGARGVIPEKCRRITMAVILASFVQRVSLRTSDRCHWCGNPFPSLPLRGRWHGEAVTDEGLASPFGRGTQCCSTGRRGRFLPSQSLRDSSPREGAKGERRERIATPLKRTGSQ